MEYSGLLVKYRSNRALTELERAQQLKQHQRLNVQPHYQLCVIKMNSTYLESVDKWFNWKGAITLYAFSVKVVLLGFLGWLALHWLLEAAGVIPTPEELSVVLGSGIAMSLIVIGIAWLTTWLLRKESFAYTHYPIRFNRTTRMVHVFRTNGTVLSVPWDKVFFTLGHIPALRESEVRGHVLEADNITVRETFALSYVGVLGAMDDVPGTQIPTDDFVRAHWEFIRRYMEDGPRELLGQVEFCMPVDARRERFWVGVQRVFANIAGAPGGLFWTLAPWCALVVLFRPFAMRTSKIPRWSKEIEATSVIAQDDPYAIAGNADGERVAVFPEAARMAGVAFVAPPFSPSGEQAAKRSGFRRGVKKAGGPAKPPR